MATDHPSDSNIISDLTETYRWLQDHLETACIHVARLHNERLFLNVDAPRKDVWIFKPANQLLYNVSDDDPGYVKAFLSPFKELLTAAGASEIQRPPIPVASRAALNTQASGLRASFNRFRKSRRLTDVCFVAGDGSEHPAHRDFMAANAEHFEDCFCGELLESGPATAEDPIRVYVDEKYPSACIGHALGELYLSRRGLLTDQICEDYLYSGTLPSTLECQQLVDLLYLSHEWGVANLNEEVQSQLALCTNLSNYRECEPFRVG